MEFIQKMIDVVTHFMSTGAFAALAMIIEMLLRVIKTDKPVGILHMISGLFKKVGELMMVVASLLDKVLPQRLK
jgi:hypothetical protein